jgi:signal transduction histidine kinase
VGSARTPGPSPARLRLRLLGLALLILVPALALVGIVATRDRNAYIGLGVVAVLGIAAAWIVGTLSIVRPVRKAFEIEHRALERLEQTDQMRTDFVSMISHELRNPMATIRGFGQMLRDQPEILTGQQRQEAYEVIVRQVDRMASLVDNVLDVSRIESDTFSYAFVAYDIPELLAETVEEARAAWPEHAFRLEVAAPIPEAKGDRDRMKQVLGNLLSNASRYSTEGSEVSVLARADGSMVSIAVRDQGRGIDAADRDRLFMRFSRLPARAPGKIRGTGLGLYISRRIVEAHGGTISVESEPGRGSTFTVTVPFEPPPAAV